MYATVEPPVGVASYLEPLSDAELLHRSRFGEDAALEVLLRRHSEGLYRFCCHLVSNREDAEDICQEALARAITRVDTLQSGSSFKSWLYSIARNLAMDSFRGRKRVCAMPEDEDGPTMLYDDNPQDRIEIGEEHQTVAEALGKLAKRHQDVLTMREVQGMSYAAIASQLDVSQSAVETLLFRARRRLREEYGKRIAVPAVAIAGGLRGIVTRLASPLAGGSPLAAKLVVGGLMLGITAATVPQAAPVALSAFSHHSRGGSVATGHHLQRAMPGTTAGMASAVGRASRGSSVTPSFASGAIHSGAPNSNRYNTGRKTGGPGTHLFGNNAPGNGGHITSISAATAGISSSLGRLSNASASQPIPRASGSGAATGRAPARTGTDTVSVTAISMSAIATVTSAGARSSSATGPGHTTAQAPYHSSSGSSSAGGPQSAIDAVQTAERQGQSAAAASSQTTNAHSGGGKPAGQNQSTPGPVQGAAAAAGSQAETTVGGASSQVQNTVSNAQGQVQNAANGAAGQVQNAAGSAGSQVANTAGQVTNSAASAGSQVTNQAGSTAGQVTGQAGSTASQTKNAVGQAAGQAGSAVGQTTNSAGHAVGQAGGAPSQTKSTPVPTAGQTGGAAGQTKNAAGQTTGQATNTVNQTKSAAGQTVGQVAGSASSAVSQTKGSGGQTPVGSPTTKPGSGSPVPTPSLPPVTPPGVHIP